MNRTTTFLLFSRGRRCNSEHACRASDEVLPIVLSHRLSFDDSTYAPLLKARSRQAWEKDSLRPRRSEDRPSLPPGQQGNLIVSAVKLRHRGAIGAAAESRRVILVHRDPCAAGDAAYSIHSCCVRSAVMCTKVRRQQASTDTVGSAHVGSRDRHLPTNR